MIIDAHTHIGTNEVCSTTAADLVGSMRGAGIDAAFVFASDMMGMPTHTLLECILPYKGILYAIGSVSPLGVDQPTLERVEEWLQSDAIYGLKFYTGYEYFYPADEVVQPYLKLLQKYNKPAIFHSGDTYNKVVHARLKYAHALHVDDVAVEFPDLKIIIAHFGYPWVVEAAEVCYKNKNVYVDCSGFFYGEPTADQQKHFRDRLTEFIRISGAPDRIIFGSDWPIGEQASYVRATQKIFTTANAPQFSTVAQSLFGI